MSIFTANKKNRVASVFLLSAIFVSFFLSTTIWANEYINLQQELALQNNNLLTLEDELGRHDFNLVEPLTHLAQTQYEANRFDDALDTVNRALQIARLNHGLYTKEQYDLLALKIAINMGRASWEEADETLRHYKWLVETRFEGTDLELVQSLQWLAEVHIQGAINDKIEQRAYHLIAATRLNETAVHQAQLSANANNRQYAELLYSLSQKYYLETRGILGGGSTSYYLRLLSPYASVVDSRSRSLEVRYRVGLEKLHMLRNLAQNSNQFDLESVGMAELYIADWNVLFNKADDVNEEYATGVNTLIAAGVSSESLNRLLAKPAVLPRPVLALSIEEALNIYETGSFYSMAEPAISPAGQEESLSFGISLFEPTQYLGGHAVDFSLMDYSNSSIDDWQLIRTGFELDPSKEIPVRNGLYYTRSHVTPDDVSLFDQPNIDTNIIKKALAHIKTLSFRPAIFNGEARAGKVALDFRVRADDLYPMPALVMR